MFGVKIKKHAYNKDCSKYENLYENYKDLFIKELENGESLCNLCAIQKLDAAYFYFYSKIRTERPDLLSRDKSDIVRKRLSKAKNKRDKFKEEIIQLYSVEKKSCYEISNILNNELCPAAVITVINENGIPLNNQSVYWTDDRRLHFSHLCKSGKIGVLSQTHHNKRKTAPEKEFAEWCDSNQIEYIFQFQIKKLSHRYDFFIPKRNLLVEIDGVFWHSNEKRQALDRKFEDEAESFGFSIIRFTDKNIRLTKKQCFEAIYEFGEVDNKRIDAFT